MRYQKLAFLQLKFKTKYLNTARLLNFYNAKIIFHVLIIKLLNMIYKQPNKSLYFKYNMVRIKKL